MQRIYRVKVTASEYTERQEQQKVKPSVECPHCGREGCLQSHGYYERYIVDSSCERELQIKVRRFRCGSTGKTVSYLPSFAQPYRLVGTAIVADYFLQRRHACIERWEELLGRYKKAFEFWYVRLKRHIGNGLGRAPPRSAKPSDWFAWLTDACGDLGRATGVLIERFKCSVLGCYRCHGCQLC